MSGEVSKLDERLTNIPSHTNVTNSVNSGETYEPIHIEKKMHIDEQQRDEHQQQDLNDGKQYQQDKQQEQPQSQTQSSTITNNRSILILREIDQKASESSVKKIFDECPTRPIHCEHALQNSWYVTFENDEDASLALAHIRKHVLSWNGHPIMARYKPKPAVPTSNTQQQRPSLIGHDQHHLRATMYPNNIQPSLPMISMMQNQIPEAPQHYGYSSVAYYGQQGQVMTPWHYTSGPQYDLSGIFVYNGLAPYVSNNPKISLARSKTVSSASLLGKPVSIDNGTLLLNSHHASTYQSPQKDITTVGASTAQNSA